MSVSVIDYDAGNIRSVEKALAYLGQEVEVTRDRDRILSADRVTLPGVGAFGDAMGKIRSYGLEPVIKEVVRQGTPFLGICLGLQPLFEGSDETPGGAGLGLLEGRIRRIPDGEGLKIPHMGWNSLDVREGASLFRGIEGHPYVYFVHSYYLAAEHEEDVAASTFYSTKIHASLEHGNIFACQFHPEKSGEVGLKILDNFIHLENR